MCYDIIGDIHGHADELKILLQKLGYQRTSEGTFTQFGRQVIYVGDFIDRGNQNIEVLSIVKPMVEQGHALAVMGNHEFNAICFHTLHPETGLPLRKHNKKNKDGHQTFLSEFEGKDELLVEVIDWFKSLPFFLDLEGLRVIHAEWNSDFIEQLKRMGGSDVQFIGDDDFFINAAMKGSSEYHIIETLLKGSEIELPAGCSFNDTDGNVRRKLRVKWWQTSGATYRDIAMLEPEQLQNIPAVPFLRDLVGNYPSTDKPVFFGHYWMRPNSGLQSDNSMCVDYSVARKGTLCSYRWSGEKQLWEENILVARSPDLGGMAK
jgi:predicted MPP superfamily phosphohydrolase